MRISQSDVLLGIAGIVGAAAVVLTASYFWPETHEYPPTRGQKLYAESAGWLRELGAVQFTPRTREHVFGIIDRGIRAKVRIAPCIKAQYLAADHVLHRRNPAELATVPALLASYRLDECPNKSPLLAVLYKYGIGVEKNRALMNHHLLKLVVYAGYSEKIADFLVVPVFGRDAGYDVRDELSQQGRWFHDVFRKAPPTEMIALAERYLAGNGVEQDTDLAYAMLLEVLRREARIGPWSFSPDVVYRLARALLDDEISYPERWEGLSDVLMSSALSRGHPWALRVSGLELLAAAGEDRDMLLHACALLLAARQRGEIGLDRILEAIAEKFAGMSFLTEAGRIATAQRHKVLSDFLSPRHRH